MPAWRHGSLGGERFAMDILVKEVWNRRLSAAFRPDDHLLVPWSIAARLVSLVAMRGRADISANVLPHRLGGPAPPPPWRFAPDKSSGPSNHRRIFLDDSAKWPDSVSRRVRPAAGGSQAHEARWRPSRSPSRPWRSWDESCMAATITP